MPPEEEDDVSLTLLSFTVPLMAESKTAEHAVSINSTASTNEESLIILFICYILLGSQSRLFI